MTRAEAQNPSGTIPTSGLTLALVGAYMAVYGVLRWHDVLIYDVTYRRGADGIVRSGLGVRDNPYGDDAEPWQGWLGPAAESVFFPLCVLEESVREHTGCVPRD